MADGSHGVDIAAEIPQGLSWCSDENPGLTRRRAGKGWSYRDAQGRSVKDAKVLDRIRALAIPPAWTDVWICPSPRGHIQATGRDQRGRKQYRYHDGWRRDRDGLKFGRMIAFGRALPKLRVQVEKDLARRGLPRDKVVAAVARLMELTLIRVGNDEYAKTNKSFGLTTLQKRHLRLASGGAVFHLDANTVRPGGQAGWTSADAAGAHGLLPRVSSSVIAVNVVSPRIPTTNRTGCTLPQVAAQRPASRISVRSSAEMVAVGS